MWSRRSLLQAIGGVLAGGAAVAVPARPEGGARMREVRALRRFAETTHPRGREARGDARWIATWSALEREADALSDGAYLVRMRRALGWFGDGHTTVPPFEFTGGLPERLREGPLALALPVRLRAFDEGLFVVAADAQHAPLLGLRVLQINRVDDRELLRRVADGWPGNPAWAHRWAGEVLASPAQLVGLQVARDARAPIVLETSSGSHPVSPRSAKMEWVAATRPPLETERWAREAGRANYVRRLEGDIVYASIDEMADLEGASFHDLSLEILAAARDARRVIIDLRRNGGGDNTLCEPLRRGLARLPCNQPGGLYVLIGPQTFSAAQNFASRLERETAVRFVGGPTGGSPNHYGDAKPFIGPVTGLVAIVSSLPWFDSSPDDHRRWIMSDVPVANRAADWLEGRDPALDAARTDLAPAVDEFGAERVRYFERPSQSRRWPVFWID
jgi:hypothetical protein